MPPAPAERRPGETSRTAADAGASPAARSPLKTAMRRTLRLLGRDDAGEDGRDLAVEILAAEERGAGVEEETIVRVEGASGEARARAAPGGYLVVRGRTTREAGVTRSAAGAVTVVVEGETFRFENAALRSSARGGDSAGRAEVRAPMPGRVVRLLRGEGDPVRAGDGVLVLEAMKMQNEVRAPVDGVVATMKAAAGASLGGGEVLFAVLPADSPADPPADSPAG